LAQSGPLRNQDWAGAGNPSLRPSDAAIVDEDQTIADLEKLAQELR
jgi:hypothetical protein